MKKNIIFQALFKFVLGVLIVGLLIFLPAGSFLYWNGLLLMGILFIPMLVAGVFLIQYNPELLRSRLDAKESAREQDLVVKFSALMFLIGFVVAGLGHRFRWYSLPKSVVVFGAILFMISYLLYAEVLRENSYLSRTIRVQEGQKVVDTGLYGLVRHPMYSATLLMFLSMPLVLGSIYSFFIFLLYPFLIIKRLIHEEMLLERELDGYAEYKKKVRYRLIPFVW